MRRLRLWIAGKMFRYLYDLLLAVETPYIDRTTEDKLLAEVHDNPAVHKYLKHRVDEIVKMQVGDKSLVPSDHLYLIYLGRRLEMMDLLHKGQRASERVKVRAK